VAAKIDVEIRNIVDDCYDNATRLLTEYRLVMDRIVHVLLEKETIGAEELMRIIKGEPEPPALTPSEPPAPPSAPATVSKETPRAAQGFQPGLAGA
jgi:cell division protease FtsH